MNKKATKFVPLSIPPHLKCVLCLTLNYFVYILFHFYLFWCQSIGSLRQDAFWNKKSDSLFHHWIWNSHFTAIAHSCVLCAPKASFWLFFTFWSIIWIYAKQIDTVSRSHRDTIGCLSNCIAIFFVCSCMISFLMCKWWWWWWWCCDSTRYRTLQNERKTEKRTKRDKNRKCYTEI